MQQVELKFNYEELNELYEQQVAINSSKENFSRLSHMTYVHRFMDCLDFLRYSPKSETLDESSIQNIADYLYDTSQSTYNLLESLLTWAMAERRAFCLSPD